MEVNDTSMLILVAFVFISILAVLVLLAVGIGALYFLTKMDSRVFTKPPRQLVTEHSHSQFPPGATRRNSVNFTASAYNQRRPQENDERF